MKLIRLLNPIATVSVLCLLAACGDNEKVDTESASETTGEAASEPEVAPAVGLESADDKISYIIGFQMASRYAEDPVLELDHKLLIKGIEDAFAGSESLVSEEEAQLAGQELQNRMHAQQEADAGKAQVEGIAFLEANKAKPGIVATASGLQYEVITKSGADQRPTAADTVKVHYHGMLTDGSVFDSSVDRGEPVSFALNGVISGWTEGLQLMAVGDIFRFYIPSNLGYGARSAGGIPPNSVLIFDVELLGINE